MIRYTFLCFIFSLVIIVVAGDICKDKKIVQPAMDNVAINSVKPLPPVKTPPVVVPVKEPGEEVEWYMFPKQKSVSSNNGRVLTDILEHLPSKYGKTYNDPSLTTTGHETIHGINSELRNHHAKSSKMNGFYCLNDKAAFILEPHVKIGDVAKRVPNSLRLGRYNGYLVEQRQHWDDMPTYLLDEWVAYIAGAEVAVDLVKMGRNLGSKSDVLIGPMEFVYYALTLGKTIEELDPNYAGMKQFKEFVAYNIIRASKVFKEGMAMPQLQWDNNMVDKFNQTDLKEFAIKWYGQSFFDKYLR